MRWSEIQLITNMTAQQYRQFKQAVITRKDQDGGSWDDIVKCLVEGEQRPRRDDLITALQRIAESGKKPSSQSMKALNSRRLKRLLNLLGFDCLDRDAMDRCVYINPPNHGKGYVGSGKPTRPVRYNGSTITILTPSPEFGTCLISKPERCLESLVLWTARVVRWDPGNDNQPSWPCQNCMEIIDRGGVFEKLRPLLGRKLSESELVDVLRPLFVSIERQSI